MIIFYSDSVSSTENTKRKAFWELERYPTKILVQSYVHSVSFFVQLFCFLSNFWITSLALNTVSHFVSVFEYGCENEGLNYKRVLIHLLRKIVWFRDYWRRDNLVKSKVLCHKLEWKGRNIWGHNWTGYWDLSSKSLWKSLDDWTQYKKGTRVKC